MVIKSSSSNCSSKYHNIKHQQTETGIQTKMGNLTFRPKSNFPNNFPGDRLQQLMSSTPSAGHPELLSHLRELTKQVHVPPNFEKSRTLVTVGGLDATAKVVDMVLAEGNSIKVLDAKYGLLQTRMIV
jgi:aspartate/methionine/tyrosine aminotransferase